MCQCNGNGVVHQSLGAGMVSVLPCSCKVDEGLERYTQMMADFSQRLQEAMAAAGVME